MMPVLSESMSDLSRDFSFKFGRLSLRRDRTLESESGARVVGGGRRPGAAAALAAGGGACRDVDEAVGAAGQHTIPWGTRGKGPASGRAGRKLTGLPMERRGRRRVWGSLFRAREITGGCSCRTVALSPIGALNRHESVGGRLVCPAFCI